MKEKKIRNPPIITSVSFFLSEQQNFTFIDMNNSDKKRKHLEEPLTYKKARILKPSDWIERNLTRDAEELEYIDEHWYDFRKMRTVFVEKSDSVTPVYPVNVLGVDETGQMFSVIEKSDLDRTKVIYVTNDINCVDGVISGKNEKGVSVLFDRNILVIPVETDCDEKDLKDRFTMLHMNGKYNFRNGSSFKGLKSYMDMKNMREPMGILFIETKPQTNSLL